MPKSQPEKADAFVGLHKQTQVFAIPNPWDVGSARMLEAVGFASLATTSSGFAQSIGRADGDVTLEQKLRHCEQLASATNVPISVDLENCFGDSPKEVASCIARVAETGVVGGSVEDYSRDPADPIYDFNFAVERVAAAAEAAAALPFKFMVTARAEQLLRVNDDLDAAVRRLQAFVSVGADVVYAPALKTLDQVRQVAASVDAPLNVLGTFLPNHSVDEIGAAGATRVSIGGGLARVVAQHMLNAASALQETGDLSWAVNAASGPTVEKYFAGRNSQPGEKVPGECKTRRK